jgi:hypothetical protein
MPAQSSNQPQILTLDDWQVGLNQQARRASIEDEAQWWNENLFAIGKGNLRSCWGPSAPIYTAPSGTTILRIFFGFYGNQTPPFSAPPPGRMGWMFLSNGNIDEVDLDTRQVTTIPDVWEPISPFWWASAKVWRPRWVGHDPGEIGGVLFGSPKGLYAWDGSTLSVPGGPAPLWLTNADTTPFPTSTTMPVGLPGIYTMEVYQNRLFVAGKNVISFSAPGNGADFNDIDGGGSFGYFGDKLVYTYTDLAASAGFLYCFGDSSTDVIANLQMINQGTQTVPVFLTQFNYSNVDPQVGHGFARPVGRWGRAFVIANGAPLVGGDISEARAHRGGIYLMFGSQAEIIGEKTTNVYITLDVSDYYPTFAPATIFGQRVMLMNGRFTDPWGRVRSLLLMWHGQQRIAQGLQRQHWSVASQNLELTNIGTYEQDSVLSPYGTDGTHLYRLFSRPDPALPKRLSTKAFRGEELQSLTIKNMKRVYLELHDHTGGGVSVTGTLTTRGGGIPNGSEDLGFELVPGEMYGIKPWPVSGAGINGAIDLESIAPDFTIERLQVASEDRTLYGA